MTTVRDAQVIQTVDTDRPVDRRPPPGTRHALNTRCRAEDGDDVALGHVLRPTWRGRSHVVGLVVAVPALVALLLTSTGDARLRLGLVVYAVGLCTMFAASAIYHRWVHGMRARCTWRRIDHAAIFAAIAGSSTPFVLVALPGAAGLVLVGAIWSVALIGAGCKLSHWSGGDRAGTLMYAATIVLGAVAIPWLWAREGTGPAVFVIAGGAAYLVGAVCFATRWPTLRPSVFSYHEVWHVFTLVAAAAQFVAMWMLAT